LIYIGAGLVVLLWARQWRAGGWFVLIAAAVSALYFGDVFGHGALFRMQLLAQPALAEGGFGWDTPFWQLLNEHKRLFRKPEAILTYLLFFSSLVYLWRNRPAVQRYSGIYALALLVGLAIAGPHKTVPDIIALLPVFAVVVSQATVEGLRSLSRQPRGVVFAGAALWGFFILHSLVTNIGTATTGKQDVAETNRRVAEHLVPGAAVLAPVDFVFNELDNFDIRAFFALRLQLPRDRWSTWDLRDCLAYAEATGRSAIVFDRRHQRQLGLLESKVGDRMGAYRVVSRLPASGYLVAEKQSP